MKLIEENIADQPPIEEISNHTDMDKVLDDLIRESGSLPPEEAEVKKDKEIPLSPEENAKRRVLKQVKENEKELDKTEKMIIPDRPKVSFDDRSSEEEGFFKEHLMDEKN